MVKEKLLNFLKIGKDLSRFKTSVREVFVLKLPAYRSSLKRLAVELYPVDEEWKPKKHCRFIIHSNSELEDFREIFRDNYLSKLLRSIDAVNPRMKAVKRQEEEKILEL